MRDDRGYFCLPEIDGRIGFTPGLSDLIAARLGPQLAHEAMTSGRRYGAMDAVTLGMIDEAVPEAEVVRSAIKRAAALAGKDPATYGQIKTQLHRHVLASLTDPNANRVEAAHFERALSG
jgi:enoyl-CoA hydratase/carnithine racemase